MKTKYIYTLLLLISFTFIFSFTVTAQASSDQAAIPATTKTIKLKVTGINCGGDILDIEKQVSGLKGVTAVQPAKKPAATTSFEVSYNESLVSEKEIRNAVEGTAGCSDPDSRPYKVKL